MAEPNVQVPVALIDDAMVERAARALFEGGAGGDIPWTWDDLVREDGPERAKVWRDDARAALEAALLSQPTPSAEMDDRDKVLDWFLALNTCPDDASRLARLAQALGYAKSFGFVWPHRAEFDPSTIRDVTPPKEPTA